MIVDARTLTSNAQLDVDVCIVGGGVAGMAVAREFIGHSIRVCLLESGGLEPDAETQSLSQGENIGHPYFALDDARPRCLGGSSYKWFMNIDEGQAGIQLRPLDPLDFEERPWVPHSGWPISRTQLDPFYQRAQEVCRLGPFLYDGADWEDPHSTQCLPFLDHQVKTVIFQLGRRETFIGHIRDQIARAENVTTYLHATATEVESASNGESVSRVKVMASRKKAAWAKAKVFILALGGIETPRLLLLSNRTNSEGLGNDRGLVGRYFMEHPHLLSGRYVSAKLDVERLTGLYDFHTAMGTRIYGRLALSDAVLRRERLLNYSVAINSTFWPLTVRACFDKISQSYQQIGQALGAGQFSEANRHVRELVPFFFNEATPVIGRKVINVMKRKALDRFWRQKKVQTFLLNHMTEQAPNPDSRVTLSDELDPLGQRRLRLNWQLSELDIRSIVRAQQILDTELSRAGLGRLEIDLKGGEAPRDLHGGWHHMGTTRMHRDPAKGVVNEQCQVHGVHNLFIAGPSTFPTGGYANPTLTIMALAIRLADHVKALMMSHHVKVGETPDPGTARPRYQPFAGAGAE